MLTLLPLLGKKISDLTLEDITRVRDFMKLDVVVTPELRDAGIALLQGMDIDSVADMIQSPESVQQLMSLFVKPKPIEPLKQVIRCPHCDLFFVQS